MIKMWKRHISCSAAGMVWHVSVWTNGRDDQYSSKTHSWEVIETRLDGQHFTPDVSHTPSVHMTLWLAEADPFLSIVAMGLDISLLPWCKASYLNLLYAVT